MNTPARNPFRGAIVALGLVFTLALFAQEATPPPASAAVKPPEAATTPMDQPPAAAPAAAQPAEPTKAEAAAPTPAPAPAATSTAEETKSDLRRLDAPPSAAPAAPPAGKDATSLEQTSAPSSEETKPAKPAKKNRIRGPFGVTTASRGHGESVQFFDDNHVVKGETVDGNVVAIMGDVIVDGEARDSAVAVMGDNTINGTVQRDAVAVMGDTTVNGTVHGRVVAVMGDIVLGPKARVDGDLVSVGGEVQRNPGAIVGGNVVEESLDRGHFKVGLPTMLRSHGFPFSSPLWFALKFAWFWILTAACLAFYALLALVFPGSIRRCGDTLVQRPGMTILAFTLTILALPLLFLLLLITIIGIPVALLVLPVCILLLVLFGKAAIYALVGRAITRDRLHPALATLLGGLVFALIYLVPFVGFLLSLLVAALGLGCAVTVLFTPAQKTIPPAAVASPAAAVLPPLPPMLPATPGEAVGIVAADTPTGATGRGSPSPLSVLGSLPIHTATPPPPPPTLANAAAALPRAGFWSRMGALAIDLLLCSLVMVLAACFLPLGRLGIHLNPLYLPPIAAAYGALLWKWRSTTIGGIVCNLKVVRLDDRPIDWSTSIVRALGCVLSITAVGLGFIWIAIDGDRQSWHDKIAGTIVVRLPKAMPLV
jgi:uncharacterized RDD family membrane protein YckC/cytoskeletal protein CcmA (bactofilin family)